MVAKGSVGDGGIGVYSSTESVDESEVSTVLYICSERKSAHSYSITSPHT